MAKKRKDDWCVCIAVGTDDEPELFTGGDKAQIFGRALLWLARRAQRMTGIGARDLTLDAVVDERRRAQAEEMEGSTADVVPPAGG